jgi:hypothetical protein
MDPDKRQRQKMEIEEMKFLRNMAGYKIKD